MTGLKKVLTIREGVVLGIGSIMGSGVLFLPSMSYAISNSDALIGWVATTLLCLPLLIIFKDMIAKVPSERGLEGWISLGLGQHIGSSVPILLLGTVCIGMPSAALIAGEYVERLTGWGQVAATGSALAIIFAAIASNLSGAKTGSTVQKIVALSLFVFGGLFFFLTLNYAPAEIVPSEMSWSSSAIAPSIVLAFWAYAGFENMTFMAGEFRNPKRDIVAAIFVSVVACGLLYIGLTWNFINAVPREGIDQLAGLFQLAEATNLGTIAAPLVVMFAVLAVLINYMSWTWGISRLIFSSSERGILPSYFSKLSANHVPKRAILALGIVFSTVVLATSFNPGWMDQALVAVSTNFTVIYVLAVLVFIKENSSPLKRVMGIAILALLVFALKSSGWTLLYPAFLIGTGYLISWFRKEQEGGCHATAETV